MPGTGAKDEIGDMARTVVVFRDTMLERETLARKQAETSEERERRARGIPGSIAEFKHTVEEALAKLRAASMKLEMSSSDLDSAADTVSGEANQARRSVTAASDHVGAAAGSVEELAASIGDIFRQAAKSTDVAARAVAEAHRTVETMQELGAAANRIREVIGLIQAIAGQTNLLALNATARRRSQKRLRRCRVRGQIARGTDGEGDRGNCRADRRNGCRRGASYRTSQHDHRRDGRHRQLYCRYGRSAKLRCRGSGDARGGSDAMVRVADATAAARSTAAEVKQLAEAVAAQAENLEGEVREFLVTVQAA
jgi:methyl-accepting chemotaxis protein